MTAETRPGRAVVWRSAPQRASAHRSHPHPPAATARASRPIARTVSVAPSAAAPLWTLPYILSVLGIFSFFCCFFFLLTTFPEHLRDRKSVV